MKISRDWLQTYFKDPLPDATALGEALTFHAFEIDGIEHIGTDDVLDVKVTPNRGHDCLSHRGIAKEISAILELPMQADPLRTAATLEPATPSITVTIEDPTFCPRFTSAFIKGVKVGPSPDWLRIRLETIGQRSINNLVDATNYVMFDVGQPLHAFDVGKLAATDGTYHLVVRNAKSGETMIGLDEKEYALSPSMTIIADGADRAPVSIAGIKGGKPTGIDADTEDIVLEAANWNGPAIRKTSQALKLRTDASARFEQVISSEIAPHGLVAAVDLIQKIAGGGVVGFTDQYPITPAKVVVSVMTSSINATLGSSFSDSDVNDVLRKLDLAHVQEGDRYDVHVPAERLDLAIPEDLVEEVGRIMGYEKILAVELPALPHPPAISSSLYTNERIREHLVSQGFSEVFTSVFTEAGERVIANKIDGVRPYLRPSLKPGLAEALERNIRTKDLLGIKQVRLFEIGTIWKDGKESITVEIAVEKVKSEKTEEELRKDLDATIASISVPETYDVLPLSETERYQTFSRYPFIVRDIALWAPATTQAESVLDTIRKEAGDLLVRSAVFDRFEKEGRISYAFRLVFQSFDKTLTDVEVNGIMEKVSAALKAQGFEIR